MIGPETALHAIGLLADTEIDLADAALQLGLARAPGLSIETARAHLSELAREAAAIGRVLGGRSAEIRLGALAGLIHARHGYAGDIDTYDALENANLLHVVARRRGLPVALGIVWLHCVRAAGWNAHGVDFPGHFLIQMGVGSESAPSEKPGQAASAGTRRTEGARSPHVLIDAFAGGTLMGISDLMTLLRRQVGDAAEIRPGMLRPMASRQVLLRLQRNVSERLLGMGRAADALDVLDTMIAIAPDQASLWRDAARLNQGLDRYRDAIGCLERFLILVPEGEAANRARARIDDMRKRLA